MRGSTFSPFSNKCLPRTHSLPPYPPHPSLFVPLFVPPVFPLVCVCCCQLCNEILMELRIQNMCYAAEGGASCSQVSRTRCELGQPAVVRQCPHIAWQQMDVCDDTETDDDGRCGEKRREEERRETGETRKSREEERREERRKRRRQRRREGDCCINHMYSSKV